jgi:L-2,4-diaminobutyrate decarboxylase
MKSILEEAYDTDTFRREAHELVDLLADHLTSAYSGTVPVIDYNGPDNQLAYWTKDFQKPINKDPLPLIKDIIKRSIHIHNPHYMGHQTAAVLPLAAITGLLANVLNQGQAVYEMGMTSNALEQIVTQWLAEKLHLGAHAGGLLTSGGTLGTLTALLTARAIKAGTNVWEEGTTKKLAIMVSAEAHYCADRAARIMGLGEEGIIRIPVNNRYQMQTDLLAQYLKEARAKGLEVFAVIGSACSTSTGSYDNLEAIADFCGTNDLWFHADGAHGGVAALSDTYKSLVKGIERADSIVIDFHKMMMMPSLVTAVLYKNAEYSYHTFQQKAQYLWTNEKTKDWFNSGKRTFECTKLAMSIKIYTVLRTYGEDIFTENVETLYSLAKNFADEINRRTEFELALAPQSNIVCFRYTGNNSTLSVINGINEEIRSRLLKSGQFYIVQTSLNGTIYLRVSIMNPLTTLSNLIDMLDKCCQIGHSISNS